MIIIKRSDGISLNLSAVSTMAPARDGLVVDFPDNEHLFTIKDFTLDELERLTKGMWSAVTFIYKEGEGWPYGIS